MPRSITGIAGIIAMLAFACVPLLSSALHDPFLLRLFTRIMIFAIAAISLDLILGYGGMVSFGHAAFVGIGGYVVGIMAYHAGDGSPVLTWPLQIPGSDNAFVVWPLAILVSATAAAIIGAISLRTRGVYFLMITLAFGQMLYFFFISLQKYGGEDGLSFPARSRLWPLDLDNQRVFYFLVFAMLVGCLWYSGRLVNSRFGMLLQGCRENERRMQAVGFPTYRYKLTAFVIAGALGGFAGVLFANNQLFVSPVDMAWSRSGELMVMVILGGSGTLVGSVLGAIIFLVLELVLSSYTVHWQVIFGPLLMLVVLFEPGGLLGALQSGLWRWPNRD